MSDDGASMGVGAERAIKTILGGEPSPGEDEQQTPEQMLDSIRAAGMEPDCYGDAALSYARVLLEAYETYPVLREQPFEPVYLCDADGKTVWHDGGGLVVLQCNIYEVLKQLHHDEGCWQRRLMSDLSGFMEGWAHNAVRYALGDPPVPNPAIVTLGS